MPRAFVETERQHLRWTESVRGRCWLEHDGEETLEYINSQNENLEPAFSLTNLETGEVFWHAEPPAPWGERLNVRLEPGETLETKFASADRFPFPAPGRYELRVRYEWFSQGERSSVESGPLRLDVDPAEPRGFDIATGSGNTGAGMVYCVWVDSGLDGASGLWLSVFSASWRTRFSDSIRLATVAPGIQPVLSVPPNTSPQSQYVAWLEGQRLVYVVHTYGQAAAHSLELDSAGYRLVPPLLAADGRPGAEALLLRSGARDWTMRVITMGGLEVALPPVVVSGPPPLDARTLHCSGGLRRTVFLHQIGSPPQVSLGLSSWSVGNTPSPPRTIVTWPGTLIAHDEGLTPDDWLLGTALLRLDDGGAHRYQVRTWQMPPRGEFRENPPAALFTDKEDRISAAILQVNADGEPVLLAKIENVGWFLGGASARLEPLPSDLARYTPSGILFVERTQPVLLYAEPGCGWRIGFFHGPIRYVPAASA